MSLDAQWAQRWIELSAVRLPSTAIMVDLDRAIGDGDPRRAWTEASVRL